MSVSSEFVSLCRSQVALLSQGLRASLSVVYLTEELVEGAQAKLIPIVADPETGILWEDSDPFSLGPSETNRTPDKLPRLLSGTTEVLLPVESLTSLQTPLLVTDTSNPNHNKRQQETSGQQKRQIILPLMHEGVVMGFLVTSREDRPWNKRERLQIEHIAHTLALACVLERRSQWWQENYRSQQILHSQQQDLLDNLLHQLRSPLTALKTFGKLLLRRLLPTDNNRDIANSILRESDRLQELLQQMDRVLDEETSPVAIEAASIPQDRPSSPTSSQPLPLLPATSLQSCLVTEILEPLLVSAQAIANERGLTCSAHIPPNLSAVKCSPNALREVLSNLIDNALKYTPAGGEVAINVSQKQSTSNSELLLSQPSLNLIEISVTDTGPGIPPQDLQHIFQRHYRGVQAETEIPGTGLGLAIAKELIEQMQGKIAVFSPAKTDGESPKNRATGPGTKFAVSLPVA